MPDPASIGCIFDQLHAADLRVLGSVGWISLCTVMALLVAQSQTGLSFGGVSLFSASAFGSHRATSSTSGHLWPLLAHLAQHSLLLSRTLWLLSNSRPHTSEQRHIICHTQHVR
eukprot:1160624-Pelagomonas_calceolata.AAC.12